MTSILRTRGAAAAAVLIAFTLSACERGGRASNPGICASFQSNASGSAVTPTTAAADAAAPVDDCVKRWSYSLAGSSDAADVVADAVVAACGAAVSHWNQTTLAQPSTGEGVSLTTGEPSNPLAEHATFARGRAILYVVEARAGRCSAPPVINGAPAGVAPV